MQKYSVQGPVKGLYYVAFFGRAGGRGYETKARAEQVARDTEESERQADRDQDVASAKFHF